MTSETGTDKLRLGTQLMSPGSIHGSAASAATAPRKFMTWSGLRKKVSIHSLPCPPPALLPPLPLSPGAASQWAHQTPTLNLKLEVYQIIRQTERRVSALITFVSLSFSLRDLQNKP